MLLGEEMRQKTQNGGEDLALWAETKKGKKRERRRLSASTITK